MADLPVVRVVDDEIRSQEILRRVLDEEFEVLTPRTQRVDVRVIVATNRDLEQEVRHGRFREDLYYRLADFTVEVPPLRARPADVPLLGAHLLSPRVLQALVGSPRDEAPLALLGDGNLRDRIERLEKRILQETLIRHRIVENHGGSLRVDNHPEGGAEFSLILPAP